jgi:hypothetical protein
MWVVQKEGIRVDTARSKPTDDTMTFRQGMDQGHGVGGKGSFQNALETFQLIPS